MRVILFPSPLKALVGNQEKAPDCEIFANLSLKLWCPPSSVMIVCHRAVWAHCVW